jgi:AbrB family looped-hinge helix DNA binding protein
MSRVTTKGQVTIPKDVRDALGIKPGARVGFRKQGSNFVLVKEIEDTDDDYLAEWVGKLKPLVPGQTVDETIDDMRGGPPSDRR